MSPRGERADVLGAGSSKGVAGGGEVRLLFFPCFISQLGKEWGKGGVLGSLLLGVTRVMPFEGRGELKREEPNVDRSTDPVLVF